MSLPELTTFAVYLAVVLTVGALFYRMSGSLSDYVLGGRRLGATVAAIGQFPTGLRPTRRR